MKCENCGSGKIKIINTVKGHYVCGKCGRDTEELYMIEHDAEIRAKAIDEFVEKIKEEFYFTLLESQEIDRIVKEMKEGERNA